MDDTRPLDVFGEPVEERVWYWAIVTLDEGDKHLVGTGMFIPNPWTFFINGTAYRPIEMDYIRAQEPAI